jgi:hypothetical protein
VFIFSTGNTHSLLDWLKPRSVRDLVTFYLKPDSSHIPSAVRSELSYPKNSVMVKAETRVPGNVKNEEMCRSLETQTG